MSLLNHMVAFDDMLDEAEEELKDQAEQDLREQDVEGDGIDPLDRSLDDPGEDENLQTAFHKMKELMATFKAFCDSCEQTWKVQEIPAALRQRLITLDQANQERYQKLYLLIQKYAEEMKGAYIRTPKDQE
jgi:hypothetical protein